MEAATTVETQEQEVPEPPEFLTLYFHDKLEIAPRIEHFVRVSPPSDSFIDPLKDHLVNNGKPVDVLGRLLFTDLNYMQATQLVLYAETIREDLYLTSGFHKFLDRSASGTRHPVIIKPYSPADLNKKLEDQG